MDPGTFDREKAVAFHNIGVTRASVGAQTFDSRLLELCGRAHSVDDIYRAVENLRSARIDNFSMDIIGGLPEQRIETFQVQDSTSLPIVSLPPSIVFCSFHSCSIVVMTSFPFPHFDGVIHTTLCLLFHGHGHIS